MSAAGRRAAAALAVGATIGATTAAGTALLLYTGQGFLRAVGLLISSTIMAVAAGVWAGAPEQDEVVHTRGRWYGMLVALLAGGVFASVWMTRAALRDVGFGGALAVLLILAMPAYAAGALLAGISARGARHARDMAGVNGTDNGAADGEAAGIAATALAGAAFGVLLATTLLIQNLEPYGIFFGAAALLAFVSILELGAGGREGEAMHDHVVLVTGAGNRGQVGFAVAQRFHAAGARVVMSDIVPDVETLAGDVAGDGRVIGVRADLTADDDVARLLDVVRERFGRLDTLVNAVGGLTVMRSVEQTEPAAWQREIERNAGTVLRVTRAALPLLREARGAVINFASPAAERAPAGLAAYSAAKAAVVALTRSLALEEKANGVRANAVAPGMVDTEQNRADAGDTQAFVSREEIADVVLFLASTESRGISGETIHVAGPTLS